MFDPFSGREISDSTFDDRAIEYQLEREALADQLDYAVGRYDDANTARSQDYWENQIESLRDQLTAYDDALGNMAEQAAADTIDDAVDFDAADSLDTGDDGGDFDDDGDWDFAGDETDTLDDYLDFYPDWWDEFDDYASEWEFDVDYEETS